MHIVLFVLHYTDMFTHVGLHTDGPCGPSWVWADDEHHVDLYSPGDADHVNWL